MVVGEITGVTMREQLGHNRHDLWHDLSLGLARETQMNSTLAKAFNR